MNPKSLAPVFCLILISTSVGWAQQSAQPLPTTTLQIGQDDEELGTEKSSEESTQFDMGLQTFRMADSRNGETEITAYKFGLDHQFSEYFMMSAEVPIYSGAVGKKSISEVGNPAIDAQVWVLKFFDRNPLWIGLGGGLKFASEVDGSTNVVSNYYRENKVSALLHQQLIRTVDFSIRYSYIIKNDETLANVDVGNENQFDGGLTLKMSDDWQLGALVLARQVEALKENGEVISQPTLFTAFKPSVSYFIVDNLELSAFAQIPFANAQGDADTIRDRRASFGGLVSQAETGTSWGLGVGVVF